LDGKVRLEGRVAYLAVPVHPFHQKCLRFEWMGRIYQFNSLAFG